jgi:hypothetical protein
MKEQIRAFSPTVHEVIQDFIPICHQLAEGGGRYAISVGGSLGKGTWDTCSDMEIISTRPDFYGANYYSRLIVRPIYHQGKLTYTTVSPAELGLLHTTMGWEVYPQGLYEVLTTLKVEYGNPDLFITEMASGFMVISSGRCSTISNGRPVGGSVLAWSTRINRPCNVR